MASEISRTIYARDWPPWEIAMRGPFCSVKALSLIYSTVEGQGENAEEIPRVEGPEEGNPSSVAGERLNKRGDKWDEANKAALKAIYNNLPAHYSYQDFVPRATAVELWDHLKSKLFVKDGPSLTAARSKFVNCVQHPTTILENYCKNFLKALDGYANAGVDVTPEDAYLQLVESIDRARYDTLCKFISRAADNKRTVDVAIAAESPARTK